MSAPIFDYDFSLFHGHKNFAIEQLITKLADKALAIAIFQRATQPDILRLHAQIRQLFFSAR